FTVELTKADKRMRAPMPANLQEIQYWIANIGNAGTAKTYLMGLKKAHELLGSEINTSSPYANSNVEGTRSRRATHGKRARVANRTAGEKALLPGDHWSPTNALHAQKMLRVLQGRATTLQDSCRFNGQTNRMGATPPPEAEGRPQTGRDTDWGLQAGTASAALYCGTKPAHDWIEEPLTSEINECLPSAVPWIRCMRDAFKRSAANHSSCDILRLGGPEEKLVGEAVCARHSVDWQVCKPKVHANCAKDEPKRLEETEPGQSLVRRNIAGKQARQCRICVGAVDAAEE
ncbi:hypothetical protein FOZ60_016569, partial [Perkinsus olseni]